MNRNVYVASSWRNNMQPAVVQILRAAGMEVYDFKNPENKSGFHWSEVDPLYVPGSEEMEPKRYLDALQHPRAKEGFESDFMAMQRADTFVLVLPCGRSAHLELGWATAREDKETFILLDGQNGGTVVPELMYKMVDHIALNVMDLLGRMGVED